LCVCVSCSRSRLKSIRIYPNMAGAPQRLSFVNTTCVCTAYSKPNITSATYICVSCIFIFIYMYLDIAGALRSRACRMSMGHGTHINDSICQLVMAHISMTHRTYIDEACHVYQCVIRELCDTNESCHLSRMSHVTCHEWVMSLVTNESCHLSTSHGIHFNETC